MKIKKYILKQQYCCVISNLRRQAFRTAFFWVIVQQGWNQQLVPKRPYEITTTRYVITQKSAVLNSTVVFKILLFLIYYFSYFPPVLQYILAHAL
jgi:cytochrome bd-type quinol oxidase subunit 1